MKKSKRKRKPSTGDYFKISEGILQFFGNFGTFKDSTRLGNTLLLNDT